jgi:hypothetical protein
LWAKLGLKVLGLAATLGAFATYSAAAKIQYKFSPQDLASQNPKELGFVCPFGSDLGPPPPFLSFLFPLLLGALF